MHCPKQCLIDPPKMNATMLTSHAFTSSRIKILTKFGRRSPGSFGKKKNLYEQFTTSDFDLFLNKHT